MIARHAGTAPELRFQNRVLRGIPVRTHCHRPEFGAAKQRRQSFLLFNGRSTEATPNCMWKMVRSLWEQKSKCEAEGKVEWGQGTLARKRVGTPCGRGAKTELGRKVQFAFTRPLPAQSTSIASASYQQNS